jgi:hydrogenase expression/formation protein HypE
MVLPPGKLPPDLLRACLAGIDSDESVIVGPGIGRDAAAVRLGDRVLVLKSDPITFATSDIGWYLVNVNANDIACMGAQPRWLLVTALLPENATTPDLVNEIFDGLRRAAAETGCLLVGGHTEITTGLDRPILVGNMVGEATEAGLLDPTDARPGDAVLLIGGIAVEGTALLASEFADRLAASVDEATLDRCRRFLYEPGISVVASARRLRDRIGTALRALHDPTEGGLATGLHELAEASGCGIAVDGAAIHVYPETEVLCDALGVDPLGLIASGALLAAVADGAVDAALRACERGGVPAARIGELTGDPSTRLLERAGQTMPLPVFAVDEIARLFAAAENA